MIELKKPALENLIKDLKALSALSNEIDQKLTREVLEMSPQLINDNYGTGDVTKSSRMYQVTGNADILDEIREIADVLVTGIEEVLKTV
jgi:hypothetical protein